MRVGSGSVESPTPVRRDDSGVFDAALDAFEEAWQQGVPPRLKDFLPADLSGPARRDILLDLVKIDLDNRWRRASRGRAQPAVPPPLGSTRPLPDRPLIEDYLDRFPELGSREAPPIDLLREEYWIRHCWGDRPEHREYLKRFPQQSAELETALVRADADLSREPVRARDLLARNGAANPSRSVDTIPAFLEALREHRVLRAGQLKQLMHDELLGHFPDTRALARNLIERGWLTPYQANQVLQGNAASLVLGSYVLLERAGEGATGKVFKARHQGMDRIVALKVIRPELLRNPEAVQRFYQEIQAASRMSHPNVVHAYDAGPVGDTHFLAMEYVEGTNLHRLVQQAGPLPIEQACDYVRQAALGLHHAFANGLVHRDVKPSNLLVETAGDRPGYVKILDLGMARWERPIDERGNGPLTDDGTVMGTPDFMSPEQAQDARAVDIRSDLYSLGCTIYYLLTGQVPFPRDTFIQKVDAQRFEQPQPLEELRPDVPAWLADVVRRLMAKRPEERIQTPLEVAEILAGQLGVQNYLPGGSSVETLLPHEVRSTPSSGIPRPLPPAAPPRRSALGALPLPLKIGLGALACCMLALLALPFLIRKPQENTRFEPSGPSANTAKPVSQLTRRKSPRETVFATLKAHGWPTLEGQWHYLGPFDNQGQKAYGAIFPPEENVDLKETYTGKANAKIGWKEFPQFKLGEVNKLAFYPRNDHCCTYLYYTFEAKEALALPLSFGSTDTLEVWHNGARVLARNVTRKADADQDVKILKVTPGSNTLLVKICNGKEVGAFYVMPKLPLEWLTEEGTKPPVYLSELIEAAPSVGMGKFGKRGDLGYEGRRIHVKGEPAPNGLSMHPPDKGWSRVVYKLNKYYHVFHATAAIDDSAGKPSASPLTFTILGDGKVLWRSRHLQQPGDSDDCNIIVSGVEVLELRVHCPGKRDHARAVWINARLLE